VDSQVASGRATPASLSSTKISRHARCAEPDQPSMSSDPAGGTASGAGQAWEGPG